MSHECTRYQYPFNEQMRMGTGPIVGHSTDGGVPDYCAIVLLLQAVLNVAITGEACSLMVNSAG